MPPSVSPTIEPFVLRPGENRDLPALKRLLTFVIGGLTTLPNEDSFLEAKLQQSEASFAQKVKAPGAEQYFFVLEDARTREIVGTSAIMARVGGFDPFYSYQVKNERISHAPLGIEKEMAVLHLKTSHKGPSEICSLFLHPKLRTSGLGRLLSLGRFLFMAAFPARFDTEVIAELRGYLDEENRSPFWDSVGRHFFQDDFHAADVLSGLGEKDFIRDLMPRHPIYVPLLPPNVQAVIGRVHRETEPAKRLLLDEGFSETDEIDIFDAGPLVRAKRDRIRTIRTRKLTKLRALHPKSPPGADRALIANASLEFRSGLGLVRVNADSSVDLDAATAKRLQLTEGDEVQFLPLSERKKPKA
jgi:arginine N-succinyltransferase